MFKESPHRRYNPLTGQWILVSPHRTKRPWKGKQEAPAKEDRPTYDPNCYLCPGNERANGERNPDYTRTYVFDNDFAALLANPEEEPAEENDLFRSMAVKGTCRVICFSPRHDLTLPRMDVADIAGVVETWATQTSELGETYRWVQVFENKGDVMGCSNPHPHGQIWASDFLPNEVEAEDRMQSNYFEKTGSPLLVDYLEAELKKEERIICENENWVVMVPYWAVWPYETLLLPKKPVKRLPELDCNQRSDLAEIMKRFLTRYDNLFKTSFPYSMGWHGAPFQQEATDHWQLHAHFYPPLLRSATVKKFMVGYEMMAEAQRDITAEQAAGTLRGLSETHYLDEV
ncbi:MAG: UDP-glucose--hexose-1-phosphate uridylyltransferase [Verrucomicrobiota bacterium]